MGYPKQVKAFLLLAALSVCAGCSQLAMTGSVIVGEFTQLPADELAVDRVEATEIPGPARPIPVRLYYPRASAPYPVLMYFHGGGWAHGSPATHDRVCRFLSCRARCVVISVDYRLAPRYKYPAAFDDVYAATLWAYMTAPAFNGDPSRIAVAGDSAGGNLAAAVALASRNRGGPPLVFQVLAFPATDLVNLDTPSYQTNNSMFGLTRGKVKDFRDHYLHNPTDSIQPYASPLRAADHSGLPPALIIVGEKDVVRDDGLRYAEVLQKSGVSVSTIILQDQGHAVPPWAQAAREARRPLEAAAQALRKAFSQHN